jgi:HSP20 family protein
MALVRWDPFGTPALETELHRLFRPVREDNVLSRGEWMPPVDIYEDEHDLVVVAELPDVRREDIQLTVERQMLTLRGERRLQQDVKEDQYHRVERQYGAFVRTFSLPDTIDGANAKADYKDGLLTIRLPRRQEARPKQIQVQVS